MIERDQHGYPIATAQGIRCGNHGRNEVVRHRDIPAVMECFRITHDQNLQVEIEAAAERAIERALEHRGYWDAVAERDREDRMGVIQFGDAYRMACPEAFQCEGCRTPEGQRCPETCPVRVAEEDQERFANSY